MIHRTTSAIIWEDSVAEREPRDNVGSTREVRLLEEANYGSSEELVLHAKELVNSKNKVIEGSVKT